MIFSQGAISWKGVSYEVCTTHSTEKISDTIFLNVKIFMYLNLRANFNKSRKFSRWYLFINTRVVMLLARKLIQMDQWYRRWNMVSFLV